MISLRATAALAVICLAMVLADCTEVVQDAISSFSESSLTGPLIDAYKNFPQLPLPHLKDFLCPIVPPVLSPLSPFPFSQPNNWFPPGPLSDPPETSPAEESTY